MGKLNFPGRLIQILLQCRVYSSKSVLYASISCPYALHEIPGSDAHMTEHSSTNIPHVPMREFTILMAFLISIVAISIDALLPALGMISKDLQMSHPNQAQYVIVFLFVGMAIGQLVCGPASDAMGRKKVLYLGIALYLAGSLLCFFGNSELRI